MPSAARVAASLVADASGEGDCEMNFETRTQLLVRPVNRGIYPAHLFG